ncbi:MAG: phosphatidate cytidylyltransferase [Deltaproteobacteria bacterium]
MLLTRIISAAFGIFLLVLVMIGPEIWFDVALAIIALIAMWELNSAFKSRELKPMAWLGYTSVLFVLLLQLALSLQICSKRVVVLLVLGFSLLVLYITFTKVVLSNNKINFVDASVTILSILYVTFLFSFLGLTRHMAEGRFIVWFVFIGGWVTDMAAYFAGMLFGRNKLIPEISPNKTIEGSVGGLVGCIIVTVIYGLLIKNNLKVDMGLLHFIILGMFTSISAQLGDLTASAIKRTTKIKDYGYIMPGHGGIIDRFDSILFVSPIVFFFFKIFM